MDELAVDSHDGGGLEKGRQPYGWRLKRWREEREHHGGQVTEGVTWGRVRCPARERREKEKKII